MALQIDGVLLCFSVFGLETKGSMQHFTWLVLVPLYNFPQKHLIGSLEKLL